MPNKKIDKFTIMIPRHEILMLKHLAIDRRESASRVIRLAVRQYLKNEQADKERVVAAKPG